MRHVVMVLFSLTAFSAAAQSYDAVVAGRDNTCRIPGFNNPVLQWVIDGAPGPTAEAPAVAAGPNGDVLAGFPSGDSFHISRIRADGSSSFVVAGVPGFVPESMAVSQSGAIYVLALSTSEPIQQVVFAFSPAGVQTGTFSVPGVRSIDLAADQCTLWMATTTGIARFNVCTGTPLPAFVTGGGFFAVRVLPDGGALVLRLGNVERYSASGVRTQTYAIANEIGAIALAEGGSRAFAASECWDDLLSIDLQSGAVLKVGELRIDRPRSVVPYFAWTAALGASHVPTVPAASGPVLALLGLTLVGAALLRMR